MSMRTLAALAAAVLLCLALPSTQAAAQTQTCTKNNPTAILIPGSPNPFFCGTASNNPAVYAYLGIPYAKPPVGSSMRWLPPQPVTVAPSATAPTYADFAQPCPQWETPTESIGSEDCLYLNVWAPTNAIGGRGSLPVMVYIHGGAFVQGASSLPATTSPQGQKTVLFDGSALAALVQNQNVIVVTLNYRLGALGFLAASNQGIETPITGNYGLLDQVQALAWVNQNIGLFGGDNTRVTLFGESAGAMSVGLHTLDMTMSAPNFQYAVMESNPLSTVYKTLAQAQSGTGAAFLDHLCWIVEPGSYGDCRKDTGWLAKATQDQILKAQQDVDNDAAATARKSGSDRMMAMLRGGAGYEAQLKWAPVVDGSGGPGYVLGQPLQGYANTNLKRKPIYFGVNKDEGVLFVGMLYGKDPGLFTAANFESFVGTYFPSDKQTILNTIRYSPTQVVVPHGSPLNQPAMAFANLATDYEFVCPNLYSANQQLATEKTLFSYEFTQAPFYDLYNLNGLSNDHKACEPAGGAVCHGNEMPYVFNNLGVVSTPNTTYPQNPTDQTLATQMSQAWVAFANSTGGAPAGWTKYVQGGPTGVFNGSGFSWVDMDANAHCSAIWAKYYPNLTARSAAR